MNDDTAAPGPRSWPVLEERSQGTPTLSFRVQTALLGLVCRARGHHNLVFGTETYHVYVGPPVVVGHIEQLGRPIYARPLAERKTDRPICRTCWAMPGD